MRGPTARRWLLTVALLGLALAAMTGPALLLFSSVRGQASYGDSETLGMNHLSSATVDIDIGEQTTALSASNLAPGDKVIGAIEVANTGTLALRYVLISEFTDDPLADWVHWNLWASSDGCADSAEAEKLISGVVIGSGSTTLFGDAGVGLDPGDRVLDPETSEVLCVAASLAFDTPDAIQNRVFEQRFTVLAEQHTEEPT